MKGRGTASALSGIESRNSVVVSKSHDSSHSEFPPNISVLPSAPRRGLVSHAVRNFLPKIPIDDRVFEAKLRKCHGIDLYCRRFIRRR